MISGRVRRLVAACLGASVAGLALATGPASAQADERSTTIVTSGTPASATMTVQPQAAAERVCTNLTIDGVNYGGRFYCGYGVGYQLMPNGVEEVWVIGTDYSVWTRWRTPNGTLHPSNGWHSQGGKVRVGDHRSITMTGGGYTPTVWVVGIDNPAHWWWNARSSNGTWSGWKRGGRA